MTWRLRGKLWVEESLLVCLFCVLTCCLSSESVCLLLVLFAKQQIENKSSNVKTTKNMTSNLKWKLRYPQIKILETFKNRAWRTVGIDFNSRPVLSSENFLPFSSNELLFGKLSKEPIMFRLVLPARGGGHDLSSTISKPKVSSLCLALNIEA